MPKLTLGEAAAQQGSKISPDVENRAGGFLGSHPHLNEGYVNLIGQTATDIKALPGAITEYVKDKFIDKDARSSAADSWQRAEGIKKRARRDLGGPRTPPYQGGK